MYLHGGEGFWTGQSFCPFMMLTGLPCPGCGITKSIVSIYQGQFLQSLQYHIMGIPYVAACILILIVLPAELLCGRQLMGRKWLFNKSLTFALAAVLMIWHTCRLVRLFMETPLADIWRQSIWA
ncbi:MAG: DUF2752 domain-containing protein [Bacteroidales bacterium]|nr:DUF2752 domain-containing protein [Bacteroidales bacterium]